MNYNIELNVKQKEIDTGIELTQGDYGRVVFSMRVKDNDEYIMNASRTKVAFNLSNGYVIEGAPVIGGGTYTYAFSGNELQSAGKTTAILTLEYGDGRVSSCPFTFNVRYNPLYDNHFESGPYIPALEQIKEQAQKQVDYLQQLIDTLQDGIGETALTRADISNELDIAVAGVKVADANAAKQLNDKIANCLQDRGIASWRGELHEPGMYQSDTNYTWDTPTQDQPYLLLFLGKRGLNWNIPVLAFGLYLPKLYHCLVQTANGADYTNTEWIEV